MESSVLSSPTIPTKTAVATKTRLYLVDAHAFLHRAYHALPPLTTSRGEPVGALYGFARMLLQLLKEERPDSVAVCFDAPGPTFRHKAYEAYKATRKEIDADLLVQLKLAREMTEVMGFKTVEKPGFEADDLMATLAVRAQAAGMEAVLVTGDKDVLQLVGPGIRVYNAAKKVWLDAAQVREKLGVEPEAVVAFLALTGDSSDNVPGVKGVGPVGAAKLLKSFGSLDALLKAAKRADPAIPEKTAKALLDGEEAVKTAEKLITLVPDVPLEFGPADCPRPKPAPGPLTELFSRFEFTSLLRELLPEGAGGPVVSGDVKSVPESVPSGEIRSVTDVPWTSLRAALKKAEKIVVACGENPSPDLLNDSPAHLALGLPDGRAVFFDPETLKAARTEVAALLKGPAEKIAHDWKSTGLALRLLGLEGHGPFADAMLEAWCLDPSRRGGRPEGESSRELLGWSLSRALAHGDLSAQLQPAGVHKLYAEVELPLAEVLAEMELRGIALDADYLRNLGVEFETAMGKLQETLNGLCGGPINVNSPKQLGEVLYDKFGLPVVHKTAKGGRSTDESALSVLAKQHPVPAKVLEYREHSKLKSTYIDGLLGRLDPATGRVHTHFDQTGTATGRLSSLDPNLQNIPIRSPLGQKIRRAFVAPKGYKLLSVDYSQIDLRVLAHASGDEVLRAAFSAGEDVHQRTACEVFGVPPEGVDDDMRRKAKAINFGIVYGQTAHGLSEQLSIPRPEAARYIEDYFKRYAGVARWIKENLDAARREGVVRTFLGRLRRVPELQAKNGALRQFGERVAGNTPIQGGSADVIKLAMLRVHEGLKKPENAFRARPLLQIHDELLFEVPVDELARFAPWVKNEMEAAVRLSVPLTVSLKVGDNWQDMEKMK